MEKSDADLWGTLDRTRCRRGRGAHGKVNGDTKKGGMKSKATSRGKPGRSWQRQQGRLSVGPLQNPATKNRGRSPAEALAGGGKRFLV